MQAIKQDTILHVATIMQPKTALLIHRFLKRIRICVRLNRRFDLILMIMAVQLYDMIPHLLPTSEVPILIRQLTTCVEFTLL